MKACLLRAPGAIETNPLESREAPDPEPGPGQIRVRVHACGVCRTDLHVVEGELAPRKSPVIPGHQIVGTVEKAGAGARRFALGARVGVAWLHGTDGTCEFCRAGAENLCDAPQFTGWTVDGGYAEYVLADESFAYFIPDGFANDQAAPLLCAGIIGFRCLRVTGIFPAFRSPVIPRTSGAISAPESSGRAGMARRGESEARFSIARFSGDEPRSASKPRLGLFGFGSAAHVAIQVARHWGAEVYASTRGKQHQELARSLGAVWAGDAADEPPEKLDAAILFAPAGEIVPAALRSLKKGGVLVLGGIHMSPIPPLDYKLLYQERVIRSVANNTRSDGEDFLRVAAEIPVRTRVTTYPLQEANRALSDLKADRVNGSAVLDCRA